MSRQFNTTSLPASKTLPRRAPDPFLTGSLLLVVLLIVAAWVFLLTTEGARFSDLVSLDTRQHAAKFIQQLVGPERDGSIAYLDPSRWLAAGKLAYETLAMSVLAIGFATVLMVLTVIPAARSAADGRLTLRSTWAGRAAFFLIRAVYTFSRAVPELLWAMLIIFFFYPGIVPGALALGLHNFGILGKLCAEVVEDLDLQPIRALRSSGASMGQLLFYGVAPQVLPQFLTYILYRWEVIIRTTIVVGFVGASGLGQEFRLAMNFFHYTDLTLLLVVYYLLVLAVDGISGALRWWVR